MMRVNKYKLLTDMVHVCASLKGSTVCGWGKVGIEGAGIRFWVIFLRGKNTSLMKDFVGS